MDDEGTSGLSIRDGFRAQIFASSSERKWTERAEEVAVAISESPSEFIGEYFCTQSRLESVNEHEGDDSTLLLWRETFGGGISTLRCQFNTDCSQHNTS